MAIKSARENGQLSLNKEYGTLERGITYIFGHFYKWGLFGWGCWVLWQLTWQEMGSLYEAEIEVML